MLTNFLAWWHQATDDWDGEGSPRPTEELVLATQSLLKTVATPPNDIYPTINGNIIVEWQYPDGGIYRIEVDGPNEGETMLTRPDLPAQFERIFWQ